MMGLAMKPVYLESPHSQMSALCLNTTAFSSTAIQNWMDLVAFKEYIAKESGLSAIQ